MNSLTTSQTRKTLLKDVGNLKRDAVQIAQDVQDHASAHVDETRQRVSETINTVRETLVANPFALLGVGFAIGLFLGIRFSR